MATSGIAEEDLQCPICTEVFGDPKMLPCTHRICKSCLNQFLESRPNARTAPCPLCNQAFKIPKSENRDYASRFRTDEILQGIICEKQKVKMVITDRPLSMCALHKVNTTMFCCSCSTLECVECIRMRHKRCQSISWNKAIPLIQENSTIHLGVVQSVLKDVDTSLSRVRDQKQKALANHAAVAFALDTQKCKWISLVEDHYKPLEQLITRAHKDNMAQLNTILHELQESQRALEDSQTSLYKITSYVSVDELFREVGSYGKPPDLESVRRLMGRRMTMESLKFTPLKVPSFPKGKRKTVLGEVKSGSEVVPLHDDTMSTIQLIAISGCLITILFVWWRRLP